MFEGTRLHVVTGKGGTGKTTVAGALAIALASGGQRVLLIEVEGRQGFAQLFDVPPMGYGEHHVAAAPGGGEVFALAIDPEAAMLEYLEMFYNIKRGGTALKKVGAVDFATTIAPGLRDVLMTGKTGEAVRRRHGNDYIYDSVVLDAPPTGRIVRFLTANHEIAGLARVGPIKTQADSVMKVIRSGQTMVHLVTLLEEMPVQETLDGIAELHAAGLPVGRVIVNLARSLREEPAVLGPSQDPSTGEAALLNEGLRIADLGEAAGKAGFDRALLATISEQRIRATMEASERARLQREVGSLIDLPALADGIDVGALYSLAELLVDQGLRGVPAEPGALL